MKKLTIWIIISVLVILIGYDAFVVLTEGTEASISSIIIVASYELPIIPFAFGFLCGHFFWRMKPNKDTSKIDKG
jgi:hypothetical protein